MAALTIPSLVAKNQEKELIVQLKKAYNVFSNAIILARDQYGDLTGWGWSKEQNPENAKFVFEKLSPFLNTVKICEQKGCFPNAGYKTPNRQSKVNLYNNTTSIQGILADGMIFNMYVDTINGGPCTANRGNTNALRQGCGALLVDVNGAKGPNEIAKDTFEFWITRDGLIPQGTPEDRITKLNGRCHTDGYGCTAWALLKGNFDYPASW